ncbi:MAG: MaoC family dehydratase [Ktedonobacteraceae bacterium]
MSDQTKAWTPLPAVGTRAERVRTITDADIVQFADVSGDHNPIHLDVEYAAHSQFGKRIAHGFLTGSLISALIGMDLPGAGSIYLGQTLKFLAPVYIDDTITASVEVTSIREDKRLVILRTDCTNQDGKLVLTGEATVKFMREQQTD